MVFIIKKVIAPAMTPLLEDILLGTMTGETSAALDEAE